VLVRAYREGDRDAVRELRGVVDREHARLMPDYFRVAGEVRAPERDSSSEIFVAEGDEGVCGFVVVRVVETPREATMTPRRRAHVEMIGVGERARRRGVGRALMTEAERWAAGRACAEVVLTVWSDNRAAEALYGGLGYEPIARVLRKSTGTS
jgi:ribosomal protein S18 acetylase RimI-like enzyme